MTPDPRLLDLLAHRPPMLLLTSVVAVNRTTAHAQVRVGDDSAFYEPGKGVPAWIGLEYMAQTVGLIVGHRSIEDGDPPPQGYLLGTRRFDAPCPWFAPNTTIDVHAHEELVDDSGLGAYNCRVEGDTQLLVRCRLTVYKKPADVE